MTILPDSDPSLQERMEKLSVENRKLVWRIESLERELKRYKSTFGDVNQQQSITVDPKLMSLSAEDVARILKETDAMNKALVRKSGRALKRTK